MEKKKRRPQSQGRRTAAETEADVGNAKPKTFVPYTEEQLWSMNREEASLTLNERQKRWCEVYVKSFNSQLAAIKAGYSKVSGQSVSQRLRKQTNICTYLAWLKLRAIESLDIRPIDILEQYAKIGFADITDYVTLSKGRLTLMDSDMIDGQVVKSYKVGPQGTSIELYDKMSALKHLEQFFSEMPKSWQQKLEERRMEIAEEKLELEREASGRATDEQSELGSALIDALRGAASVWKKEGDDPVEDDNGTKQSTVYETDEE